MRTMNKFASITLAALLFLITFTNVRSASSKANADTELPPLALTQTNDPNAPAYVPEVVIVEVKQGVSLEEDLMGKPGHLYRTSSALLDATLSSVEVSSITPLLTAEQANKIQSKSGRANSSTKTYKIQLKGSTDINALVAKLSGNSDVVFAEPDYIAYPAGEKQLMIDDPLYSQQWGMTKINIETAWSCHRWITHSHDRHDRFGH